MAGLHMKKHSAKIREHSHWCLVFSDSEKNGKLNELRCNRNFKKDGKLNTTAIKASKMNGVWKKHSRKQINRKT